MTSILEGAMETFVPLVFLRRGVQRVAVGDWHVHDATLIEGLARAFYWQHLLDVGAMESGSAIAKAEGLHHSVVNELLRMTLLAPDVIDQFMAGRQPRTLTLMWFQRNRLPVDWQAQRQIIANFEADL